jgi:membrane-associated PAP2 superfamily phosphatase
MGATMLRTKVSPLDRTYGAPNGQCGPHGHAKAGWCGCARVFTQGQASPRRVSIYLSENTLGGKNGS